VTYIAKPKLHHPKLPTNELGYTRRDYEGSVSTLCAGCGHDSITAAIIQSCFDLALPPHRIAKLSGIGCSSKTPTYFLGASHGFNTVHGRMPSVLTGANLANRDLIYLGISGDKTQLVPLIAAAIQHQGAAFIDCISPCVAFNNHAGSTKSYDFVREHNEAVNRLDFMPQRETITADYAPGEIETVEQHDGSRLILRKLAMDYDPHDRISAMTYLAERQAAGEIVTGLLYVDPEPDDLHAHLATVEKPLSALGEDELCPGSALLEKLNASLR
jgi:pyruvate/2-oxoacid:ferredoxin oxidoreductase beta subunit